ncbi:trypsin-like peptidase domain-containing protein [Streptomyces sp. NPDC005209]|uniref:trypsin-like serine peptidase n=1 Tax=Streptomyces sp. NPDC005209 TaxID=3156715 RepID=UPI0033BF5ACA
MKRPNELSSSSKHRAGRRGALLMASAGTVVGLITPMTVVGTADAADAPGVSTAATSKWPTSVAEGPRWTAAAAERFWTNRRMAEAKPIGGGESSTAERPLSQRALSDRGAVTRPESAGVTGVGPRSSHFGGLAMIGRMYMQRGSGSYFCTASVIKSRNRNIVLTAGHCMDGRAGGGAMAFVPQWTAANPRPHGVFPVATDTRGRSRVWIDQRYYDRGHTKGAPWDVAFAQVGARSDGKKAQDVVGANTLATGRGYAFPRIRLIGYPNADQQPLTCTNSTTRFTPTDGTPGSYLRIACDDYRSGTSGGPFLANFNSRTGTGDVVGSIGGWKTGGPTADISYSPYFGSDIQRLYDAAVNGSPPARPRAVSSAPR